MTTKVPYYFGHLPYFATNPVSTSFAGANCLISSFEVYNQALSMADLKAYLGQSPKASFEKFDDISILNIFGMMRHALDNLDNLVDPSMRHCLAHSGMIGILMQKIKNSIPSVKASALILASYIFPRMDIELIDFNCKNSKLSDQSFLRYLLESIGAEMNIWANQLKPSNGPNPVASEGQSIIFAKIILLRSFINGNDDWSTLFKQEVVNLVLQSIDILKTLKEQSNVEMVSNASYYPTPTNLLSADVVYSLLAILGGKPYSTLSPGAQVLYVDENSGMAETATILGPTHPPVFDSKSDKEEMKRWNDCNQFGDAIAIVLSSQPNQKLVVPRSQLIASMETDDIPTAIYDMMKSADVIDLITRFFQELADIDTIDYRPKPKAVEKMMSIEQIYESDHPYADNKDISEEISFPGAKELEIVFDEKSRTESGCDYIEFFHDSSRKDLYGVQYHGRDGSENWPGCGGRDSLIIPASSFYLHFHSDASGNVSTQSYLLPFSSYISLILYSFNH